MKRAILVPPIIGLLAGFFVSFLFTPRYISDAKMVLLQPPVPPGYLVLTSTFIDEFESLTQLALSAPKMRPAIHNFNLVRPGEQEDQLIQNIRAHVIVTPQNSPWKMPPTFYVRYSDYDPIRAQNICRMLTALIVNESQQGRDSQSSSTLEFLQKQLDDAKARVATIDKELIKYRRKGKQRSVEEESRYRSLLHDYEDAKKFYADLLAKLEQAEISDTLEDQQELVRVQVLEPATLPQAPDFPDRLLCAVAGLGVGIAITVTLVLIRRSTSAS
jgi:uncharacterized protein involved in exopolysaccharide biosynthesis